MIFDEQISNYLKYKATSSTTYLNYGGLGGFFEILSIKIEKNMNPVVWVIQGLLVGGQF